MFINKTIANLASFMKQSVVAAFYFKNHKLNPAIVQAVTFYNKEVTYCQFKLL